MTAAPTANIGPLQFELIGATAAAFPAGEAVTRFGTADLEVEVRLEGNQTFLVIDHRLHPEPNEPSHIELWRCISSAEADAPHLLVVADRAKPSGVVAPAAGTLLALIESLPNRS